MKKSNISKFIKYFLATIGSVVSLGIIGYAGYYIYTVLVNYNYEETFTDYTVSDNIQYEVYMKNNGFIKDAYLDMDKVYIAKLVDRIDSKFSFDYTNEETVPVTYSYTIKGILTGNFVDKDGKEETIWTEETDLKMAEVKEVSDGSIKINNDISTNISTLTARVKAFQEAMGLNVNANYKMVMEVKLGFDNDGKEITKLHTAYLNIPINSDVFAIERVVESNASIAVLNTTATKDINKMYLILAISALALALIGLINILKYGYVETQSDYDKEIKDIFKLYGDRIVTVENIAQKDDSEFMDLVGFEEMVELVNELNLPILCWNDDRRNETWFCAIKGNIIYRYLIEE